MKCKINLKFSQNRTITNSSFPLHKEHQRILKKVGCCKHRALATCQWHDGTTAVPPKYVKVNIPWQTACRSTMDIALSRTCWKSVAYWCERGLQPLMIDEAGRAGDSFSLNWCRGSRDCRNRKTARSDRHDWAYVFADRKKIRSFLMHQYTRFSWEMKQFLFSTVHDFC